MLCFLCLPLLKWRGDYFFKKNDRWRLKNCWNSGGDLINKVEGEEGLFFWESFCEWVNEFQFFSIRPFFLKNIDLNKKLILFTYIVYHSFNHFMYLPKLIAHGLLILWMFVNLVNLLPTLVMIFNFKLVSVIFYQIFIFAPNDSPLKIWKMFFISSKILFSFSRYSNICNFLPSVPNFPDSKGQAEVL